MNDLDTGDTLIREGVDEFKKAALQTANGIIGQGLAVLKIKQGCEAKQGGTDFPEVAMRELGLTKPAACEFLRIGIEAEKLLGMPNSLPSESRTTLYQIARMEPDVIADKIARGVIHPNATLHEVLEKPRKKRIEIQVSHDDDDLAQSVAEIYKSLKPSQQKILKKQYAADLAEERKKARADAKAELEQARKDREHNAKARVELDKARRLLQDPFTRDEFQKIRGMLHPDRHPGNEARAKEAFELFRRIEPICKKVPLKAVK